MKKMFLAVAVVLAALLFVGCGEDGGGRDGELGNYELVVVVPSAAQGWIAAVHFHAERHLAALEAETGLQTSIMASANIAEQAGQLDELIDRGVDVIVLFPHSDELDFAAQNVVNANIPLFVFNRNVNVDFHSRLLGSNELIGRFSAETIVNQIGGSGTVAYISVPAVGSTNVDRLTPFHDVMAQHPGIELVTMTTTAISMEEALTVTTDMLTANPHIDAIFTIDDQLSMGALQAIREAGRTDVRVMNGAGGMQAYFEEIMTETGMYLFTVTFAPTMIMDTVDLAIEYLRGRTQFPNITIIEPSIVTRDNAAQFIVPGAPW